MARRGRRKSTDPADTRMTLGEHLDELRGCLVRSLLAFALACIACIWPAKYLLELMVRPLVLALRAHDQPLSLLQTSPVETVVVYIKVVLIAAFVISGPYIIYQFWSFVAVGLYPKEKAWVYRLVGPSVGLFLAGVEFMYAFALLASLNFLVGFGSWLPMPRAQPTAVERILLHEPAPDSAASQPSLEGAPQVAVLWNDPPERPNGAVWFNETERRLKIQAGDETYSYQLQRDDRRAMVTTHFKIGEYLTFVLVLVIAFGLAFQLPLVVIFLSRSGIVPVATFRKYRKPVILLIIFIAGMLAPPDLLSHILLSGPMIILFEVGLLLAGRRPAAAAGTPPSASPTER